MKLIEFSIRRRVTVTMLMVAIIAFGAAVESWLLASIWNLAIMDFQAIFFQYLISLGLFPVVAWVFLRWQQAFLPQD